MTKKPNKRLIDAMYHYYNSHSRRVSQHYIHARTKHPFFCDVLFRDQRFKHDGGPDNHLKLGRKTKGAIRLATPVIVDMSHPAGNDSGHIGSADEPIRTITTFDNIQVATPIVIDGVDVSHLPKLPDGRYLDIRLRMLKPSELAAAHSFPKDYILTGNRSEQVKQIGNSVPVMTAAAMCEADFKQGGIAA